METIEENNNKVSIFSEPEKIDAVIKTKLSCFRARGGSVLPKKAFWTESEIELMDGVILSYITEQGMSRERTAQQIKERWGISMSTARRYIKECIDRLAANTQEDSEKMRRIWMERCESILTDAIENHQKDSALKALDMLGKSMGLYRENVNISGGETPIHFDFS